MESSHNKKNKVQIIVVMLVLVGLLNYWYLAQKKEDYLATISGQITTEETKLVELSVTLSNSNWYGERDIVSDCDQPQRARFDDLLSRLSTLNRTELSELDNIFGSCAYYFSTVQSVKVANLKREVEIYNQQLQTMLVFDKDTEDKLQAVLVWNEFIKLAEEQSVLVSELVTLQGQIIDLLMAYNTSESDSVKSLVSRAQEVRENIIFLEQQMKEQRTSLLD